MSRFVFRLPDLGEGTVSAEIVAWLVKPGDQVADGQPIAEMSTEKAVVELPSPVTGKVISLNGVPGDAIAVGNELIVFESADGAATAPAVKSAAAPVQPEQPKPAADANEVRASPATRRRAREAGIDLSEVNGSGPRGRIEPQDLESALKKPAAATIAPPAVARAPSVPGAATEEIKVLGVRRVIAQRMSAAKRNIPHFSYVEEVDVTELEALRLHLIARAGQGDAKLTLLPFLVAALVPVLQRFPQCNAHYDEARDTIIRFRAVHAGIATQTKDGLKVPVVRHAESLALQPLAAEIRRVTQAARDNSASREILSGSTITVTSLGKLGGIASTPIINAPEVAIIGVNRVAERVVVHHGTMAVRRIMNLSSSFDHRFVDGFDAAAMIQALKERLEHPATIFIP
ncbi:MAG TPA: dihydrolipoamide acetyltransferase family protein [Steroidobacteraceae bacterium]